MRFGDYLKTLTGDTVDRYKRWFFPTFTVALLFSLLGIAGAALLFQLTVSEPSVYTPQSLLRGMFGLYSGYEPFQYSYSDLSRPCWFLLIAFFMLGIVAMERDDVPSSEPVRWGGFIRRIRYPDFWTLLGMGVGLCVADYLLAYGRSAGLQASAENVLLHQWILWMFFEIRLLLPLLGFSYALKYCLELKAPRWSFRNWAYALAGLWLVEALSGSLVAMTEYLVFPFPVAIFGAKLGASGALLVVESVLAIPLQAFFFIGFGSAMLSPSGLTAPADTLPDPPPTSY